MNECGGVHPPPRPRARRGPHCPITPNAPSDRPDPPTDSSSKDQRPGKKLFPFVRNYFQRSRGSLLNGYWHYSRLAEFIWSELEAEAARRKNRELGRELFPFVRNYFARSREVNSTFDYWMFGCGLEAEAARRKTENWEGNFSRLSEIISSGLER